MIEWISSDFGGGNVSVDPDAMTVTIDGAMVKVDVCNVIPAMKAGRIAVYKCNKYPKNYLLGVHILMRI